MNYKDKSFCSSDCTNKSCHRLFSDEEKAKAIKWWGGPDVPVAFSDFSANCKDYKK